jgi:hypothetical protein
MPNLTVKVAPDRPPVIDLAVAPTQARAEALEARAERVPLPVVISALLDTGADISLIAAQLAADLSLDPTGVQDVFGVGAAIPKQGIVYRVRLSFGVGPVELAPQAQVVAVEHLSPSGVRMILGRDLLSRCVLIYNGPQGDCTFAF